MWASITVAASEAVIDRRFPANLASRKCCREFREQFDRFTTVSRCADDLEAPIPLEQRRQDRDEPVVVVCKEYADRRHLPPFIGRARQCARSIATALAAATAYEHYQDEHTDQHGQIPVQPHLHSFRGFPTPSHTAPTSPRISCEASYLWGALTRFRAAGWSSAVEPLARPVGLEEPLFVLVALLLRGVGDSVDIRAFEESDLDAIVEFSLRAWEPVYDSLRIRFACSGSLRRSAPPDHRPRSDADSSRARGDELSAPAGARHAMRTPK
jgi:hypothetical protein